RAIRSARQCSTRLRNEGGAALQDPASKTCRAAATARATSSSHPAGIVNNWRPFAGLTTATVSSLRDSTSWPSRNTATVVGNDALSMQQSPTPSARGAEGVSLHLAGTILQAAQNSEPVVELQTDRSWT